MRCWITLVGGVFITTASLAAPPPEVQTTAPRARPIRPATPVQPNYGPTVLRGDVSALQPLRSVFDRSTRLPTAWQRIQPDLDRSLGRLEDRYTYELNRLELQRLADAPGADPRLHRELLEYERDRELREREMADRATYVRNREELMKNREYELWLNSGLNSSVSAQAEADRQRLAQIKLVRDQQLKDAGDDAAKRSQIEVSYQNERARILGVEPAVQK